MNKTLIAFTYWQDGGMWLGYLDEFSDQNLTCCEEKGFDRKSRKTQ
ncbi:hypothetical protein BCL69_1005101 [Nitrosomonas communis]|uniref:Uncharacterized protein n=1 Tax=Nitrosomonas communis TaxID=44574 RepID=A0A5D3YK62_9PROT|nr:hypothetical protein BCL69_1005101 [Nitrosomonas communis]